MRYLVIILVLAIPLAYSYSPHDDPAYHLGANCTPCHLKFNINNSEARDMFPCVKSTCHRTAISGYIAGAGNQTEEDMLKAKEDRYKTHLNTTLCIGCHFTTNGTYNIHLIHTGFLSCRICHQSPRGWNSSIATVPAPRPHQIIKSGGFEFFVPETVECGYCHLTAKDPTRLHDIHEPVLEKACDSCHSSKHTGNFCFSCHDSFYVNKTSVQKNNCKENGCHSRTETERQNLHLKEDLCQGCHINIGGDLNVHLAHQEFLSCRICHQSTRGWNSSIATIPAPDPEAFVIKDGIRFYIPESSDCGYCHTSAKDPARLHDVHQPVIEKACASCHNRTAVHSGELCISCHDDFEVRSENVSMSNCKDNTCHPVVPEERHLRHVEGSICLNCHDSTSGRLNVHTIHRTQGINCRICHQSVTGWNSTIATIPAPDKDDVTLLNGVAYFTPERGDCAYCHPTALKPKRLHDVHEQVLDEACSTCHTNQSLLARDEEVPEDEANVTVDEERVLDMSCGGCHQSEFDGFFTGSQTAWIAKLHMWAGASENFIGPSGEIRYEKNFTNDMQSNSCLLCHPIEEVNIYTNQHTKIGFRACTNESCHGDENTVGTDLFVAAGELGLQLNTVEGIHDREVLALKREIGWKVCVQCHIIHPGRGLFNKIQAIFNTSR
jgi:hypothetical protein